jgi:hypothetical protein
MLHKVEYDGSFGLLGIEHDLNRELNLWFNSPGESGLNYTFEVYNWFRETFPDYDIPYNYSLNTNVFRNELNY